jgi:hypothetical protein
MTAFEIEVLSQHWIRPGALSDLCTHGTLQVVIGDELVAAGGTEYGLSPSALALLRTIGRDHTPDAPVAQRLVFHGCSLILMQGCPIGIDWSVVHVGELVTLSDIRRYDTTSDTPSFRSSLSITVPLVVYREQVLSFASRVRGFVEASAARAFDDTFDRKQYDDFWQEYGALLDGDGAA